MTFQLFNYSAGTLNRRYEVRSAVSLTKTPALRLVDDLGDAVYDLGYTVQGQMEWDATEREVFQNFRNPDNLRSISVYAGAAGVTVKVFGFGQDVRETADLIRAMLNTTP